MGLLSHVRPPISSVLSAMYSDVRPLMRVEGVHLLQSANNQIATYNLHSTAGVNDFMLAAEFIRMYGNVYTVSQAPISTVLSSAEMFTLEEYYPFMDISVLCEFRAGTLTNILLHKYGIYSKEYAPSTDIMRDLIREVCQMSLLQIIKCSLSKPSDKVPAIWGLQHYEESGEFMLDANNVNFAKATLEWVGIWTKTSKVLMQKLLVHHIACAIDKVIKAVETAALISLHRKPNMEALKNGKVI